MGRNNIIFGVDSVARASASMLAYDEWMVQFYVLFNSISVISVRWADDNEKLYAVEPHLRLRRVRWERGSNPDR